MNKSFRIIDDLEKDQQEKIIKHKEKQEYNEKYASKTIHCINCSGIIADDYHRYCDVACFKEWINRKK